MMRGALPFSVVEALSHRRLEWQTAGPWTYALGGFGTIRAIIGLSPWAAHVNGQLLGRYATLGDAQMAVEAAAIAAGYSLRNV
jgi:hypothetical protein